MNDAPRPQADDDDSDPLAGTRQLSLPDDLPPVEPPSAGMIVQLFLVPAVIVAVIVAVYALFGRMASQELDWRQLTTDVRSENAHVRWRGALGLAQMLDADAQQGAQSQHLAAKPEIASALAELYGQLITHNSPTEEELKQIEFLSKALGRLESPEAALPVLEAGMQPDRNHDVRKHSLIGLAMLAGTLSAAGHPLDNADAVNQLIEISRAPDPLFRHQAAYDLGLLQGPAAQERLIVLLEDPDQMVRANAAIGLARQGKPEGLTVFHELLRDGADWKLNPAVVATPEEEATYFERMLMLTNTVKAVSQSTRQLDDAQRAQFAEELRTLMESTRDAVLRTDVLDALQKLKAQ